MSASQLHLTRRSIVKGAAWSVPVIAAAVAAPITSASGDPIRAEWRESSLAISQSSINAATPFMHCVGWTEGSDFDKDWKHKPFKKTVVITYTGDNDDFTFEGAYTTSHYIITEITKRSVTMTHTDAIGPGCHSGFTGFNLFFNGPEGMPTHEIEDDSIKIEATGVALDFIVEDIIDVTPCSPIFGLPPTGPREVPVRPEGTPCPNGQPSDPYA